MIILEDVETKQDVSHNKTTALREINLTIKRSEAIAIVSKSIKSRTILLRCIAALEPPMQGKVILEGNKLGFINPKQRHIAKASISFINNARSLLKCSTVFENIASPLVLQGSTKLEINKRVIEMISLLDLQKQSKLLPNKLSSFQTVLTCLGRSLITNPKLLVCDNLTAGLDLNSKTKLIKVLQLIRARFKITLVIATSDVELIKIMDKVITLEHNTVKDISSSLEFFLEPKTDTGHDLIKTKARQELPVGVRKKIMSKSTLKNATETQDKKLIMRIISKQNQGSEFVLVDILEKLNLQANILTAGQEIIQGTEINFMFLEMFANDESLNNITELFQQHNLYTEVLGYVK